MVRKIQTFNLARVSSKSCIHVYTTSKYIELESPGWSAFEPNLKTFKTQETGTSIH